MRRKILALLGVGFILFAAVLVQMTAVQAAAPSQSAPDAAADEPQPLPQPIRIIFRQSIPFTISLVSVAPLTTALAVTDTLVGVDVPAEEVDATGATTATAVTTDSTSLAGAVADALAEVAEVAPGEATTDTAGTATDALTDTLVAVTEALTEPVTMPLVMTEVPVTLTIELDVVVSDTLTTTVPADVTLELPDATTTTLPVSVLLAPAPDGTLAVELISVAPLATPTEEPTSEEETPAVTPTAEVTATVEVTATAEVPPVTPEATPETANGLPIVNTTATVTANLRSGPATTFEAVGQASPGQTLPVVAISEDGQWYLLSSGAWVASFLAAEQPANLPIATQAIIDQVAGTAPAATPAATPEATEVVTATATPVPAAITPVTPTVTVDANLRAGPGTEFPVIGGTVTGQALNIVGRNADGTWFRLDNTGWVFGELVSNLPPLETVPVVNADGTPVASPIPEATAAPEGGLLLPTPTPVPATPATSAGPNADYLAAARRVVTQYDAILVTLDGLIAEATANSAQLASPDWATRVNAAVTLLRQTTATVGELNAPTELADIQQNLETAAQQYTAAANALQQAASSAAVAQLEAADAAITLANESLTAAEAAIARASQ